jgi:aspartate aminotransferase-like enzyme
MGVRRISRLNCLEISIQPYSELLSIAKLQSTTVSRLLLHPLDRQIMIDGMGQNGTMLMTPGPTAVPERVRTAMSQPIYNPDVEREFVEFYYSLIDDLGQVYGTDDDIVILGGEGILGLEASLASLLDGGEQVLCLSNGLFGEWFENFVELHGGEPVSCSSSYTDPLDVEGVKSQLETHDIEIATMVHCETPTGVLNDLDEVLSLCAEEGVITIVDAVSSLGGTPVPTDDIDICIGASQKCLSSPPGLTMLSVSDDAWDRVHDTEQTSFYTSLDPWEELTDKQENEPEHEQFPYTHLVSNLYALDESVAMVLEEGLEQVYDRHTDAAALCREMGREIGLSPYPPTERCSPTVTAFGVEDQSAEAIQRELHGKHDITIATSLASLTDDIIRVGHMGANANQENVERTMESLESVLS